MRQGKHEHRNEIVSIPDELLRQDAIRRDEYKQLTSILSESLDEMDHDSNPEGEEQEMELESNPEEEEDGE